MNERGIKWANKYPILDGSGLEIHESVRTSVSQSVQIANRSALSDNLPTNTAPSAVDNLPTNTAPSALDNLPANSPPSTLDNLPANSPPSTLDNFSAPPPPDNSSSGKGSRNFFFSGQSTKSGMEGVRGCSLRKKELFFNGAVEVLLSTKPKGGIKA